MAMTKELRTIITLLGKSKDEDRLFEKFAEAIQEEFVPTTIGKLSVNQSTGHLIYTIE